VLLPMQTVQSLKTITRMSVWGWKRMRTMMQRRWIITTELLLLAQVTQGWQL
jgi:hypothetical protein